MANVWYISFHGGKSGWNNIHVFDTSGNALGKALNTKSLPDDIELRELRDFTFGPDGRLYVVNAYKKYSQVLTFTGELGPSGQHDFIGVYVERNKETNAGLKHPFAAIFSTAGDVYVSSQDTNVVTRYDQSGQPMPLPPVLKPFPKNTFYPGTFAPSSDEISNGLEEVRDLVFGPSGDLLIADRDGNAVKRYDGKTGKRLADVATSTEGVLSPDHLLLSPGTTLYVGCEKTNSVLKVNLVTGDVETFIEEESGGLCGPAGMCFGDDGRFYIGSRKCYQVLRFQPDGTPDPNPFLTDLGDQPEFVKLVPRSGSV